MFVNLKGNILFHCLMKRPDIQKAYKMVGPEDSWYDTISTVHNSLAQIQQLPREKLQLCAHDGAQLKAIYYPGNSDKTVIWIHGYTSHAERESAFPGLFYHSLGFNVLIPYLRAHGISEGKYISFGPMECKDMQAWVQQINQLNPNGSILLHGLSMGGGIALDLATVEMQNVKGFVVDAPSYSIDEFFSGVSKHMSKKHPEKLYTALCNRFQKEFAVSPKEFNRIENIKRGLYPLLLTAGSNEQMDDILLQIKQNNPADSQILILPGCNHGNGMYKQTEMYQNAIKAFLEQHFDT